MNNKLPDYNFHDANRWLDQQDNVQVMSFSAKIFSDALADLIVEPAKTMMPKTFAQWTGRLWAVLAAYFFFVIAGNLLEFAAPLVVSVLVSSLMVVTFGGFLAQRSDWLKDKYEDFLYWWHTR